MCVSCGPLYRQQQAQPKAVGDLRYFPEELQQLTYSVASRYPEVVLKQTSQFIFWSLFVRRVHMYSDIRVYRIPCRPLRRYTNTHVLCTSGVPRSNTTRA